MTPNNPKATKAEKVARIDYPITPEAQIFICFILFVPVHAVLVAAVVAVVAFVVVDVVI